MKKVIVSTLAAAALAIAATSCVTTDPLMVTSNTIGSKVGEVTTMTLGGVLPLPFDQGENGGTAAAAKAFLTQREQEIVDGHAHGIGLLELDIIVEIPVKLTGKIAQYRLEKRVDGAHIEMAVIKQQLIQRLLGQMPYRRLIQMRFFDKALQVVALGSRSGQGIEFADDALFHLVGRLIGKGDGQQQTMGIEDAVVTWSTTGHEMSMLVGSEEQVLDILQSQVIGLARARRGLQDHQVAFIVGIDGRIAIHEI